MVGEQADDAVRAVFGLGEQVGGDPFGVAGAVGEDEDFARAGELVDGDGAEHLAFGLDDVGVAGAEDFDHGRDGLRAVGERGDGLRAADLVDLGGPGEFERAEERGGDVAVGVGGGGDDDLGDARGGGEGDGHDRRGDERRGAAGDVDADAREGIEAFADLDALAVVHVPVVAQAFEGEGADVFVRLGHGVLGAGVDGAGGGGEFVGR